MSGGLSFDIHPNPHPVTDAERAAVLASPGFGKFFTDHMAVVRYTEGKGWYDARIEARAPIPMDPASAVLHYAQEIFEGLKAYKSADGAVTLFRPEQNARRFQISAERMAMPILPEEIFLDALHQLIKIDQAWIPDGDHGTLYLRPFMFASEVFLGVRPAMEYLFLVIASPAGDYFAGGVKPITLWATPEYTRAAPGGTGAAKCGGNYATSLRPQSEAIAAGCDQVVFLDAVERKYIDELGGMNVFFVYDDGTIVTPPTTGTILKGITRDSVMALARDAGHQVVERLVSIDEWQADATSGRMTEAFACGTAAVITPVSVVKYGDGEFTVADGEPGEVTMALRDTLTGIQRGTFADTHGWMTRLG